MSRTAQVLFNCQFPEIYHAHALYFSSSPQQFGSLVTWDFVERYMALSDVR